VNSREKAKPSDARLARSPALLAAASIPYRIFTGAQPTADKLVIDSNGALYGTTEEGGLECTPSGTAGCGMCTGSARRLQ